MFWMRQVRIPCGCINKRHDEPCAKTSVKSFWAAIWTPGVAGDPRNDIFQPRDRGIEVSNRRSFRIAFHFEEDCVEDQRQILPSSGCSLAVAEGSFDVPFLVPFDGSSALVVELLSSSDSNVDLGLALLQK
jgi:hypothetical protein